MALWNLLHASKAWPPRRQTNTHLEVLHSNGIELPLPQIIQIQSICLRKPLTVCSKSNKFTRTRMMFFAGKRGHRYAQCAKMPMMTRISGKSGSGHGFDTVVSSSQTRRKSQQITNCYLRQRIFQTQASFKFASDDCSFFP